MIVLPMQRKDELGSIRRRVSSDSVESNGREQY